MFPVLPTDNGTPSVALDETVSRRQMLSRLAGLGLVAAGSLAVLPQNSEAKPKQRNQRRQSKSQDKRNARPKGGNKASRRQNEKVGAQDVVSNPRLYHPTYNHLPPLFTVVPAGNGYVNCYVSGRIVFTTEHIALMKAGRRFKLSCKVMEADSGGSLPDDYCFDYATLSSHYYPANRYSPPRYARFSFFRQVPSSWLNDDVDDGWWDTDDDEDDPYGRITLWSMPKGGTWKVLSYTKTNEDQGYY